MKTVALPPSRPPTEPADLAANAAETLEPAEQGEENRTRPSGINIGGHTVTQATEHLPDRERDTIRWLHSYARQRRFGWQELSGKVGISTSTISRVFSDQYRFPKENVERSTDGEIIRRTPHPKAGQRIGVSDICEKIARFKRQMEFEGKAANPEFIETSIFESIEWLYGRVARNRRMAFIYGDGQVGKSTSLKEVAHRNNGGRTIYAEMPPASGVQFMLKCIAKSLDVPPHKGFDALLEDVLAALDESKTLIIDEIHRVFTTYQRGSVMRCLDTLRYLHDQRKCGLILCGTNVFRDKIKEGEFKNFLKQFHRRGRSYELQLPTVAPWEDVVMMGNWFGLGEPTREVESIVHSVVETDGIGVYRMRLVDAQDLAENKKEKLNWGHFIRAYGITENAAKSKDTVKSNPAAK